MHSVCRATLLVLVVQFGMGMILNLYVSVPASDQHASYVQEVETAPFALTVHALLGIVLIGAAVMLVIRAVGTGDRLMIALAAVGLDAILGAFVAGEAFVRNGQNSVSLTMAMLTGVALACYIAVLGRDGVARRQNAGTRGRVAWATPPAGHPGDTPLPQRRPGMVSGPQQAGVSDPLPPMG